MPLKLLDNLFDQVLSQVSTTPHALKYFTQHAGFPKCMYLAKTKSMDRHRLLKIYKDKREVVRKIIRNCRKTQSLLQCIYLCVFQVRQYYMAEFGRKLKLALHCISSQVQKTSHQLNTFYLQYNKFPMYSSQFFSLYNYKISFIPSRIFFIFFSSLLYFFLPSQGTKHFQFL